ncbi:hypothetical protein A2303_03830 [Candidatus Falkowbacteria bacterium RIFOXYB2_FULL_47_14]|uniref:Xylose isomerase-like TIM barrel domain-containing protein n=1 Tax=Candidatus Falkowbacteria bacterium RIFOXYA2_FULL_47_19 TaxID=1797994 RepID=A0A1F5SHZ2_9BACT|nr:MAG: hypothetical protein A2227_03375 [Candidatus Falkowbacteria bacterium RIFOXYA2_FULL_47_19]OGF42526.1 MAG: hypothetical protein A2303_03830 [Candidatus Falkowbacteria bacterium RIFOXYB2_FULL_47_14]
MELLTDPSFVTACPWALVPDSLADMLNCQKIRGLNLVGSLNRRAMKIFSGLDLNLTVTGAGIFKDEYNHFRPERLEKFIGRKWPIYAFHGGHENLRRQFRHMETRLEDDSAITRSKLFNQIWAARLLSAAPEPVIVFHPGFLKQKAKIPSAVMRNIGYAVSLAEDLGVTIALENMPRASKGYYIGSDFRDLKTILRDIKSAHLGVCFDWGHANNYAGDYARENNRGGDYINAFGYQHEMISELNKDIVYAHLHFNLNHRLADPSDKDDEHLSLVGLTPAESEAYKKTIRDLVSFTAIEKFGYALLEVFPKKVFDLYPFWPTGSNRKKQYESVKILRRMTEDPNTSK